MAYFSREKYCDRSGGSIYKLVILAAKRGLEIAEGQPKLVNIDPSVKPSTVALYEIAEGKIKYKKLAH